MREGFEPVLLDTFGGRCTLMERGDLPLNLSPDSQNVEFFPGGVKSRVGFTQLSSQAATLARYSSVISYIKSATGTPGRLLFRWDGKLQKESPSNSFSSITGGDALGYVYSATDPLPHYMNGLQIEDDVYFALSNGKTPEGRQRRFNIGDSKMRPFAPSGPYDAMTMNITGGTQDTLDVYATVVFEYEDGTLSPCSTTAYDGSLFEPTQFAFTYVPLGPSGVVRRRIYMTPRGRSDFFTHPYLWINDNTTATLTLTSTSAPDGTSQLVTDEILSNGFPLPAYCVDSILPPPATGISTFNGRTLVYGLMNMIPYRKLDAEVASRGFAPMWLELGVQNPAFDAGAANDPNGSVSPSGFLLETFQNGFADTNAADPVGGAFLTTSGQYGTGWKMTGDGSLPSIGQINAVINGANIAQIAGDKKLGFRVRIKKSSASLSNSTNLYLAVLESYVGNVIKTIAEGATTSIVTGVAAPYSSSQTVLIRGLKVSGGADTLTGIHTINSIDGPSKTIVVDADTSAGGLAYTDGVGRIDRVLGYIKIPGSAITTEWKWFDLDTTGATGSAVDLVSRANAICIMMAGGTNGIPTVSESIMLDEYHLYPSTQPMLKSSIFGSEIDDPNHFRAGICELQVNPQDGEMIKSVFDIRGNCYVVKENSMWTIGDNGLDFAAWDIGNVSPTVGTPSIRGVGKGEGFVVIASTTGLYAFYGGVPDKISDEIQPDWNGINWTYGHLITVHVDSLKRRILVGVPTGSSTVIDKIFVLDFFEGFGNPVPGGNGRKWTIWTLNSSYTLDHIAPTTLDSTTTTGSVVPCLVGGQNARVPGSGFVAVQDPTGAAVADTIGGSSTAINSYYETASVGLPMGRALFGFLMAKIRGSGSITPSFADNAAASTNLAAYTLSTAPLHDAEWKMNRVANQLFFKFGTNGTTSYWSLKRLSVELKRAFSNARGHNA